MLIIGARGFAKELLEELKTNGFTDRLVFFDDQNTYSSSTLFEKYPIIDTVEKAMKYLSTVDNRFVLGLGNPIYRQDMDNFFTKNGGQLTTVISNKANVGSFDVRIDAGCTIMSGSQISNSVKIGRGSLIYYNSIVTHDCKLGAFTELSPGAIVLGRTTIGDHVQIGANATILHDLNIGDNVIIGAGAVVLKDIPSNTTVVGNPGKVIRSHG